MIGDPVEELETVLLHRDQPFLEAGDRDAGAGVGVDHRAELRPGAVNAGVDDVARRVDPRAGIVDRPAVQIDLHQARGRDLGIVRAERVDQEVMFRSRHPRGDVVVDQVGHAEMVDQPITGRELDPHVPFPGGHAVGAMIRPAGRQRGDVHGGYLSGSGGVSRRTI